MSDERREWSCIDVSKPMAGERVLALVSVRKPGYPGKLTQSNGRRNRPTESRVGNGYRDSASRIDMRFRRVRMSPARDQRAPARFSVSSLISLASREPLAQHSSPHSVIYTPTLRGSSPRLERRFEPDSDAKGRRTSIPPDTGVGLLSRQGQDLGRIRGFASWTGAWVKSLGPFR